jgi:hypothetical protein
MTEFDFDAFMAKAILNEWYEDGLKRLHKLNCPESVHGHHDEPDVNGYCSWCKRKIAGKAERPPAGRVKAETDLAYEYYYDPDYGNDRLDYY